MRERPGRGDKGEMVEIKYCARCGWLPRSAWMAQELLGTFGEALGGVSLVPSGGGIFEVRADGELVWSREEKGRFPEIRELKRAVRDAACPGMDLGHTNSL